MPWERKAAFSACCCSGRHGPYSLPLVLLARQGQLLRPADHWYVLVYLNKVTPKLKSMELQGQKAQDSIDTADDKWFIEVRGGRLFFLGAITAMDSVQHHPINAEDKGFIVTTICCQGDL